ncbi:MAG: GWxTD domain-containing protein [Bacteroidota bacterium]
MKKAAIFFIYICLITSIYAQNQVPGLFLDVVRFHIPYSEVTQNGGNPYVEIHLAVAGNTLNFVKEADGQFQAKVNIQLQLDRIEGTDTLLVENAKYNLQLPQDQRLADTARDSRVRANLLNVHALRLDPGTYLIRATAVDSNSTEFSKAVGVSEFLMERIPRNDLAFSDIKWVAGAIDPEKGRQARREDLVPMVTNSTFFNEDKLSFYFEIYNSDKIFNEGGKPIQYAIRSVIYQGDNRLMNYQTDEDPRSGRVFNLYKKTIDISNLSSNIYYLQVELFHPQKRIMKKYRQKFYVYNSRKDISFEPSAIAVASETDIFNEYSEEQLDSYLRTLTYKATNDERFFIEALENYEQKKNFLYSFFERRSKDGRSVQAMWNGYLTALKYVNQQFKAGFREGWQTDRGRVFLTYGIPNNVDRHPAEGEIIPYEIWSYNKLGSQTNVLFVFHDPDRATGDYPLLHSNKYGELNNPRWRLQLQNQGQIPGLLDYESDQGRDYSPGLELNRIRDNNN